MAIASPKACQPCAKRCNARIDAEYGHADRRMLVTSGTSGALVLAMMALVDPGDEVIVFDPSFVMYPALVGMAGGTTVVGRHLSRVPHRRRKGGCRHHDADQVDSAQQPGQSHWVRSHFHEVQALAQLAAERGVALLSDEIYRLFCYDGALSSPAQWNDQTLVVDGFSKAYGVTGWRVGWIHGPAAIIDKLTMLQQYTFVCTPHPLQWAALAALQVDMSDQQTAYAQRRDLIVQGLRDAGYETTSPGGAFYVFPRVPDGLGTGSQFVARAIESELLMIPGGIFSQRDTHFRISFAASQATLERGLEVLRKTSPPPRPTRRPTRHSVLVLRHPSGSLRMAHPEPRRWAWLRRRRLAVEGDQ